MGMAELDPFRHKERGDEEWARLERDVIKTCEKCGGTGQVYGDLGWDPDDELIPVRRSSICSCKTDALFKMKLHEAGLPREFWQADTIVPDFNADKFSAIDDYVAKIAKARQHGLGLVLTGKNGAGKTTCAARIAIGAARHGYTVSYVHFPHLVDAWRRAWKDAPLLRYLDERVCTDFLIIDELGKEHVTSDETFVASRLDGILRMRRGDLFPTILITNLTVTELVDRYGASMESMLADRYMSVRFKPGDFRKSHKGASWSDLLNEER